MARTLIVGIDTVAGSSLAQQLAKRSEVSGLWFSGPKVIKGCQTGRVDSESLRKEAAAADVVVFCGGAAQSSWDPGFGDFTSERQWLSECIDAVHSAGRRLVLISSDAVFCGPWVFHDDDSSAVASDRFAKTILKYESLVAGVADSLIVRTNITGTTAGSFVAETVDAIRDVRLVKVDAATFATPIAPENFAAALAGCLDGGTTGYVNIAGAERSTPFHFAMALANHLNLPSEQIQSVAGNKKTVERSMRCNRLRDERDLHAPLMRSMLECLAEALDDQRQLSVAA